MKLKVKLIIGVALLALLSWLLSAFVIKFYSLTISGIILLLIITVSLGMKDRKNQTKRSYLTGVPLLCLILSVLIAESKDYRRMRFIQNQNEQLIQKFEDSEAKTTPSSVDSASNDHKPDSAALNYIIQNDKELKLQTPNLQIIVD